MAIMCAVDIIYLTFLTLSIICHLSLLNPLVFAETYIGPPQARAETQNSATTPLMNNN